MGVGLSCPRLQARSTDYCEGGLPCEAPDSELQGGGVAVSKHGMSFGGKADLGLLRCLVRLAKLRASGSPSTGAKLVLT